MIAEAGVFPPIPHLQQSSILFGGDGGDLPSESLNFALLLSNQLLKRQQLIFRLMREVFILKVALLVSSLLPFQPMNLGSEKIKNSMIKLIFILFGFHIL